MFLRSEREIFRYVAALVPNVADAEDIVQQTALALWERFDSYDPNQPFTPWACRFTLNKARQWIERRQRWQALLENGLAEELASRREELKPELERRLAHLEGCLGKLQGELNDFAHAAHRRAVEGTGSRGYSGVSPHADHATEGRSDGSCEKPKPIRIGVSTNWVHSDLE
jgi:RNA polymerase sigma factor (sigma-70 family)